MKLKINLSYDLVILLLCKYPGLMSAFVHKKICARIFIVALFIIAEIWKHPKCPYAGEWINKLRYFHAMEYFLQKNKLPIHTKYG